MDAPSRTFAVRIVTEVGLICPSGIEYTNVIQMCCSYDIEEVILKIWTTHAGAHDKALTEQGMSARTF